MGTFLFSLHMLKQEYKKCIVYILTLCLSISAAFIFFHFIDNPSLNTDKTMGYSFCSMLSFWIIAFCAFMIVFANNFYISRKTKDIAIMTISGASFIKNTLYLCYQNIVMTMIAFPIGLLLGAIIIMILSAMIEGYTELFVLASQPFIDTVLCVLCILAAQLFYASGFVYRKDIHFLLTQEKQNVAKDERLIRLPHAFYTWIYFLGLVILWTSDYSPSSAVVPCCFGALGIGGMIKYHFYDMIQWLKKKKYLGDKIKLISLSQLCSSLRCAYLLICVYAISTCALIAVMMTQMNSAKELVISAVGFFVVMILLLISIVYKFIMEASTRKMFYYNLYKLGYSYHQLMKIIRQEVFLFFLILIGFPMVYIVSSLLLAYQHQVISMMFMIEIIVISLILAIVCGLTTYFFYKNDVLKVLNERRSL